MSAEKKLELMLILGEIADIPGTEEIQGMLLDAIFGAE